jgi:hypothetical protein
MSHPTSTCGACAQADDHPKHQILVGFNNPDTGGEMFHPHDTERSGVIYYHFDCPSEWHDLHAKLAGHDDPDTAAERTAVADAHQRIVALAKSGVHGSKLRDAIVKGDA